MRDAEWALIASPIPPAKRGGRERSVGGREVAVREVMNGVLYVLETGCQWRALPKDLPPKSTVHDYLMPWAWDGTLARVHHALYLMVRDLEGREASPECRGDRQPEREKRGKRGVRIGPPGTDAGKKVTGKKRHLLADTRGLILAVVIRPASLRDRDGALLVLDRHTRRLSTLPGDNLRRRRLRRREAAPGHGRHVTFHLAEIAMQCPDQDPSRLRQPNALPHLASRRCYRGNLG